jgi:acetylornithine deacetylase/succinyl-diaminopimelate desuccinylase-like protein
MSTENTLTTYFDANRERLLEELLTFVRIPSVSTDPSHRQDIDRAADWVANRLRRTGPFTVERIETARHPVVYAEWCEAPGKPTILIYGHYDVQPPDPLEKWLSAPFEPEVREGRLYGRGVSDDKAPMFIPIAVAEAFFATRDELPVNVKLMFEGEEEIGSPSLEAFITQNAARLAADFVLSADGAMWKVDRSSITAGTRGMCALDVEVRGPKKDLHSGRHGGAVPNPLHVLVELLASLHEPDGTVAVEGFYDAVSEPTAEQRDEFARLSFDDEAYREEVGAPGLFGEPGYTTLERQWTRPTLELNGLSGGYQGEGTKTVIPSVARGKITCRLVPNQDPAEILELIERHIEARVPAVAEVMVIKHEGNAPAYRIPRDHPGLGVARSVLRTLDGQEPALVLAGGTLPVCETYDRVLGLDTVYFSFSTADEDFHAPNEFFRVSRFWDGLRAWAEFWEEAGRQVKPGLARR